MRYPNCQFALSFGVSLLLLAPLTMPALGQSSEEDNVETLEIEEPNVPIQPSDVDPEQVTQTIIRQTNDFREAEGVSPVEEESHLMETAQFFADYMARTDRYGHKANGQRPADRAAEHDYQYCIVSENIAYQFKSTGFETNKLAERLVEGWKNSPEHRKNMLDPDVQDTGVAVARSEKTGHWYAVQMFGLPKSEAIEFKIANKSETELSYSIGEQTYTLPPRYVRTHMRCRTLPVRFDFPSEEGANDEKVQPASGERYNIVQDGNQLKLQQVN